MDKEIPREERIKAKRRRLAIGIASAAAIVAAVIMVSSLLRPTLRLSEVSIGQVDTGTIECTINASGRVVPAFEEIINSPISTRILEVYRKAGDSVDIGTPLLRLDLVSTETELNRLADETEMRRQAMEQQRINGDTHLSDLAMQVKVKAMAVDRMEAELRNERYLDSLGSGTGDRVRQAELAYLTGKLELDQMRQRLEGETKATAADLQMRSLELNISSRNLGEARRTLEDAQVRSPRRATLTYVADQVGQKVSEGERIAVVADLSHFKVEAEIADALADRIAVGEGAIVRIGKQSLRGIVSNITPQSRNGVVSFTIKLDDDSNSRLRSGLKTDVYVLTEVIDSVVRVPNGSFYTGPGEYDIFVINSSSTEAISRKVKLGESNFDYIEVLQGLSPGDRAIISDLKDLRHKHSIKIK